MNKWFLTAMRCPFCAGKLQQTLALEASDDALDYGLLECGGCASEFPVIEGIPLLLPADSNGSIYAETAEDVLIKGAPVSAIIAAIQAGDKVTAFGLLLNPVGLNAPSWRLSLPPPDELTDQDTSASAAPSSPDEANTNPQHSLKQRVLEPLRKAYRRARSRYRQAMLPTWRLQLAEYLQRHQQELSARDVINLYFGEYSGDAEIGHYFLCRFAQPRHLAALSVAQLMRSTDGPLLDVACGAGHLTHFLSYQRTSGPVVGVDRDFFRLFLAKRYIAPQAQFACVTTDPVLPFVDDFFAATLCSDAFHIMRFKKAMVREFRRVMPEQSGSILLTRVSNNQLPPHEGYELNAAGYAALFDNLPCAIVDEDELKDRYLRGEGPDLSRTHNEHEVDQKKWLTLVASPRQDILKKHGSFDAWPHAVGQLGVNPIYIEKTANSDGTRYFEFAFPSAWYAYENAVYRDYASPSFQIDEADIAAVNAMRDNVSVQARLQRYELLGMPARYLDANRLEN